MVERRVGGETGIAAVTCLEGADVWRAAEAGDWPRDLAEAALEPMEAKKEGRMEDNCENPALFVLAYRDGFRGYVLMLNGHVKNLSYAARRGSEIEASDFYLLNGPPHPHFTYLSLNIEEMFVTGAPSYPVERALLTSGALEAALDSRHQGHIRLETPHLDVRYRSYERLPWRPSGPRPTGAALIPLGEH